jgi:hypothetical protein
MKTKKTTRNIKQKISRSIERKKNKKNKGGNSRKTEMLKLQKQFFEENQQKQKIKMKEKQDRNIFF